MVKTFSDLEAPKGKFIVGHIPDFSKDPLGFIEYCGHTYGEVIPLRLGWKNSCILTNPQHIEEVLQQKDVFVKSLGVRSLKGILGQGLVTNEGESWFKQRRISQPIFYQKQILSYGRIMVDYTKAMLNTWNDGEVRDVNKDMMGLTLSIVMKAILSQELQNIQVSDIVRAFDTMLDWFDSRRKQNFLTVNWSFLPENIHYRQAINKMDESIYRIITERIEGEEKPDDLLSIFLQICDEDGNRMSHQQIRDEINTLIFAGHETTANTLSWTIMLLAQNPDVENKLLAEINSVLNGNFPTVENIPQLTYTENVIKESMRLYPPVPIMARESIRDYDLGDYRIPAKSSIMFAQWLMHRHPKYFENPEQFIPERWENSLEKQLPPCVYFPFGNGPRICIGKGFAMMEAVLLLASIIQNFKFSLVKNHPIVLQPSITLRPKYGIKVQVCKR